MSAPSDVNEYCDACGCEVCQCPEEDACDREERLDASYPKCPDCGERFGCAADCAAAARWLAEQDAREQLQHCQGCDGRVKVKPSGRFIAHHARVSYRWERCPLSGKLPRPSTPDYDDRERDPDDEYVCARCGGSVDFVHCDQCDEFGMNGHDCGEDSCCCLYPEENLQCSTCSGARGWRVCGNSTEWCEAHPLPGRENVKADTVERRVA